ncbi:helix-turn-helix domain-containing protein [Hydrogenivirga sp. 128-5-R1-1]|uniref:helix-turn-helix domain-containing protein n=1 Tax=Hydrogenivirga sp. 128-5-R1-1 TaxID=392423 RepID=UPI00015F1449|nr:helix-turn-helix domain-containing protein [Hydrogenivirga sp. 128-5-R1-1]EDP73096.1 transcriptional regulator (NifA family) protein [Hydrogenivirga sp. 128-5-R1-1]
MVILSKSEKLDFKDLPVDIKNKIKNVESSKSQLIESLPTVEKPHLPKTVQEIEKQAIERALQQSGYVIKKAAKLLGMTPRQVRYRMEKYNIPVKR